jgi:hypothetical protein
MAKKNKGEGAVLGYFLGCALMLAASLIFLPFLSVTYFRYRKLNKMYRGVPNTQRIYDVGNLFNNIFMAIVLLAVFTFIFICIGIALEKFVPPEYLKGIGLYFLPLFVLFLLWTLKKSAEGVAVEYFGVMFNDNDHSMHLPADLDNMGLSEILRLHFLRRLGDQDRIDIKKITNITREKGVNFYIHGDFGSRKIHFTNKQKRDECISALQARTRVRGGRDYGY